MEKGNFTPTEAKVLVELMEHQRESDRSIAGRLKMAPSNFAVVKKRLISKGALEERITMNVSRLPEARCAAFVWVEYNRPVRERYEAAFAAKVRPELPMSQTFGGKDWSVNVNYFRSFEEGEGARLRFSEMMQSVVKPYVANYTWKFVPLSHLTIYSFPSRLTKYAFTHQFEKISDLEKAELVEHTSEDGPVAKLNETEKKVLIALRKYPEMRKSEIAEKVGIQQSSLSEVANRLERKGVIAAVRMPDPRRLPDRDIATFTWIDLSQPIPNEDYQRIIREIINQTPQLYRIYLSRTFILIVAMFHSLDKAESSNLFLLELFGSNLKSLSFKIVPTQHLQMIHHPLFLEKLLGVSL